MLKNLISIITKVYFLGLATASLFLLTSDEPVISLISFLILSYIIIKFLNKISNNISNKLSIKPSKIYCQIVSKIVKHSKQPTMILNKKLEIIYINDIGSIEFKANLNKINLSYSRLINKFNFTNLNPAVHPIKNKPKSNSALSVNLNAKYSSSFKYNNIKLNFTARPFKLFFIKLGMIVEFNFESNNYINKKNNNINKHYTDHYLQKVKLDIINKMLKNTNPNQKEEYLNLYNHIENIISEHANNSAVVN